MNDMNDETTPKRPSERGGINAKTDFGPEHRATARAIFESRPGVTCQAIAREMGVHEGTVRKWKSDADKAGHPWRAAKYMPPTLAGRAGELANSFKVKASDMGPMSPEQEHLVAKEVGELAAVDVRARVIERHRAELQLPRKLIYQASQEGNADKAKLALTAMQTLDLLQKAERRAFNLPTEAFGPDSTVIEIVRGDAPQLLAPPDEDEGF